MDGTLVPPEPTAREIAERIDEIAERLRQAEREQARYDWLGPFRHMSPRWRGLGPRLAALRAELADLAALVGR